MCQSHSQLFVGVLMHHMLSTMCFSLSTRLFASGSMLKAFNGNPQLAWSKSSRTRARIQDKTKNYNHSKIHRTLNQGILTSQASLFTRKTDFCEVFHFRIKASVFSSRSTWTGFRLVEHEFHVPVEENVTVKSTTWDNRNAANRRTVRISCINYISQDLCDWGILRPSQAFLTS